MSWGLFLGMSLIWTGILSAAAELLTKGDARPHFARAVWRGAAALMALPWLAAGIALAWPNAVADLPIPDFPDLAFGTAMVMDNQSAVTGAQAGGISATTILLTLLVAGWLFRLVCAVRGQVRLQLLKKTAVLIDERRLSALAEDYAETLDLRSPPSVYAVEGLASPFAAGITARRIFLPQHIVGSGHERMIIAHESVHISRGDLFTRPFERLVADLIWFSPFAWFARNRLDYLREAVCDAETIRLTGQKNAYARALVDVARRASEPTVLPVAAFVLKDRRALKRRIVCLLGDDSPDRKRMGVAAAVSAIVAMPLALAQGIPAGASGSASLYTHTIIADDAARISYKWGGHTSKATGEEKFHKGVDIAAPFGAPVHTPADAKVNFCGEKSGYGNVVDLLLADGTKLRFAQLKKSTVKVGDEIKAGSVLGYVGKSGANATGPHLHLEVWRHDETGQVRSHDPEVEGMRLIN